MGKLIKDNLCAVINSLKFFIDLCFVEHKKLKIMCYKKKFIYKKLRYVFNTQPYTYHMLLPHGKGKMTYKDRDYILEQYEGEFQH